MSILDLFVGSTNKNKKTKHKNVSDAKRAKAHESSMRKARHSEQWTPDKTKTETEGGNKKATLRVDISASDDQAFHVAYDGPKIRSIRDLRNMVSSLSPEQISAHIRHDGNDFAAWVGDVFGEHACAEHLGRCGSGEEMVEVLARFCDESEK